MNILAIETATTACAIGLHTNGRSYVRILDLERRHTEVLTAGIRELLSEHSLVARDLTRVVADRGPGLFTGLRVGIATAQALAHGVGAEMVAATSLELLARSAARSGVRGAMYALVDARRGELFAQSFELTNDVDGLEATGPALVTTPDEIIQQLNKAEHTVTISGDGVQRYGDLFASIGQVQIRVDVVPSLDEMLAIAQWRSACEEIVPLYLREADAVANFTTRQRSS